VEVFKAAGRDGGPIGMAVACGVGYLKGRAGLPVDASSRRAVRGLLSAFAG
jgi:hypothetical protein